MAVLTAVADALTAELNDAARSWRGQLMAVRMNVPIVNREAAQNVIVIVTPISRTTTRLGRGVIQDVVRCQIGIQKVLEIGENAETDPLIQLGETIQAYLDIGAKLGTMNTSPEETSFGTNDENPWLSVRDVDNLLLYTGVIGVTFRVIR